MGLSEYLVDYIQQGRADANPISMLRNFDHTTCSTSETLAFDFELLCDEYCRRNNVEQRPRCDALLEFAQIYLVEMKRFARSISSFTENYMTADMGHDEILRTMCDYYDNEFNSMLVRKYQQSLRVIGEIVQGQGDDLTVIVGGDGVRFGFILLHDLSGSQYVKHNYPLMHYLNVRFSQIAHASHRTCAQLDAPQEI